MVAVSRYVEINKRMNAVTGAGAAVLTLLTLAVTWGRWSAFSIIALAQFGIIAFNILLVNNVLLKRWGIHRAELTRAVVNIGLGVFVYRIAHWPVPSWFFLPYVALVFDHLGQRVAIMMTVATCLIQSSVAIFDGVGWLLPTTFTIFALFCSAISYVRFSVIRSMLVSADEQRGQLEREIHARKDAERDLRAAQKLEAVGRLAAGVAHEINTPLQFVSDTTNFLVESTEAMVGSLERLQTIAQAHDGPMLHAAVTVETDRIELDYLKESLPDASRMVRDGLQRVTAIVSSLKQLANPERPTMTELDLNAAVRSALILARHEYRYIANVREELSDLPRVACHVGQIEQVLLNLIVNAAHAISERGRTSLGTIIVRTRAVGHAVEVSVTDDGAGIPVAIHEKIFEPFFTTKEVGRGSGQGLAISRAIIVDRHAGELTFESAPGGGTTFTVRLPMQPQRQAA